jgi:hypothetical protein
MFKHQTGLERLGSLNHRSLNDVKKNVKTLTACVDHLEISDSYLEWQDCIPESYS